MENLKITDILPSLPKTKRIVDLFHSSHGYELEYLHLYFTLSEYSTRNIIYKTPKYFTKNYRSILFVFLEISWEEVDITFDRHENCLNELLDTYISHTLAGKTVEASNPFEIFSYSIRKQKNYQTIMKIILSKYSYPISVEVILPYIMIADYFIEENIYNFFGYKKSFKFETVEQK